VTLAGLVALVVAVGLRGDSTHTHLDRDGQLAHDHLHTGPHEHGEQGHDEHDDPGAPDREEPRRGTRFVGEGAATTPWEPTPIVANAVNEAGEPLEPHVRIAVPTVLYALTAPRGPPTSAS
jgi:hypothetical protein